MKVDYVDSLEGRGGKLDDPNAPQQRGCGTSFTV